MKEKTPSQEKVFPVRLHHEISQREIMYKPLEPGANWIADE